MTGKPTASPAARIASSPTAMRVAAGVGGGADAGVEHALWRGLVEVDLSLGDVPETVRDPCGNQRGRRLYRCGNLHRQTATGRVGDSGSGFYRGQTMDKKCRHQPVGDLEIVYCTLCLRAIQGTGGDINLSHAVVFNAVFHRIILLL